jgi:hypothetical protein
MQKIKWMITVFLLCIIGLLRAEAQSFDYNINVSAGTYQDLGGATILCNGSADWSSNVHKIPVGFSFQFDTLSFDSLYIEPNGFVKFDNNRAVVIFQGAGCKRDSSNNYSTLSYTTSGTTGSKILKIQFNNCGYDKADPSELMDYQLWLYEQNNKIEIHTGSTSYAGVADSAYAGPTPLIGLINPLQNGTVNALLLSGDGASPSPQPVNAGSELLYLDFVPPSNRVYTFTPGE